MYLPIMHHTLLYSMSPSSRHTAVARLLHLFVLILNMDARESDIGSTITPKLTIYGLSEEQSEVCSPDAVNDAWMQW